MLDENKKQQIFEALQGITYLDWMKLRHSIDRSFQSEVTSHTNKIEIATPGKLKRFYDLP